MRWMRQVSLVKADPDVCLSSLMSLSLRYVYHVKISSSVLLLPPMLLMPGLTLLLCYSGVNSTTTWCRDAPKRRP